MIKHTTPNHTFGGMSSLAFKPSTLRFVLFGPKSFPPISGGGTLRAPDSPANVLFLKINCSIATAADNVITAKFTPRTRNAGIAINVPNTAATNAPMIGPSGNGRSEKYFDKKNPAVPAIAICAKEICPTKPTSTTSEREITIATKVLMVD